MTNALVTTIIATIVVAGGVALTVAIIHTLNAYHRRAIRRLAKEVEERARAARRIVRGISPEAVILHPETLAELKARIAEDNPDARFAVPPAFGSVPIRLDPTIPVGRAHIITATPATWLDTIDETLNQHLP